MMMLYLNNNKIKTSSKFNCSGKMKDPEQSKDLRKWLQVIDFIFSF